ncbi:MAG TPA: RNA 3'-phosphate cyclase [Thermodesulfobacteriaceae bacterium]|nr:RNA 3'-phosphate cyclase [Thermodesulfobacteriaceae bacterium]
MTQKSGKKNSFGHFLLEIDGSYGEGGGQVLRSSLTLAAITGRPVEIRNIRARRPKPGLRAQHLACVRAAASICSAGLEGCRPGSMHIVFRPGSVRPGRYEFKIETAGSAVLVLQTVLLPLAFSGGNSRVTVRGGTHVPWSPCFHYLDHVFRPVLSAMGADFDLELVRWGWYPRGGGEVRVWIRPAEKIKPFNPETGGSTPEKVKAISASSRLPAHVRRRQAQRMRSSLEKYGLKVEIEELDVGAACPGSLAFCWVGGPGMYGGFTALGARGRPAEKVADEAVSGLLGFLESRADADRYLTDQLILPAVLACGESGWSSECITSHLCTNTWVVEQFGLGRIKLTGERPGYVVVSPG